MRDGLETRKGIGARELLGKPNGEAFPGSAIGLYLEAGFTCPLMSELTVKLQTGRPFGEGNTRRET